VKAVIFDLDGTLVDSAPDIVASANALLTARGWDPLAYDLVRSFIGNGVPKLVERVMTARNIQNTAPEFQEWVAQFTAIYAANPVANTVLYPGVADLLARLTDMGVVLGVCTNKTFGLTMPVLQGLSIDGYFGSVIGGDTLAVKKPDPAPLRLCMDQLAATQTVYVGDSEVDAATAVAAGLPFALFTEGYRKSPVALIPHQTAFSNHRHLGDSLEAMLELASV